ncbi:hypothetical protein M1307_03290 [Patescibacteria group bacterium]|nr:hypothetical protein [Patescibacteria group bacterium]
MEAQQATDLAIANLVGIMMVIGCLPIIIIWLIGYAKLLDKPDHTQK